MREKFLNQDIKMEFDSTELHQQNIIEVCNEEQSLDINKIKLEPEIGKLMHTQGNFIDFVCTSFFCMNTHSSYDIFVCVYEIDFQLPNFIERFSLQILCILLKFVALYRRTRYF